MGALCGIRSLLLPHMEARTRRRHRRILPFAEAGQRLPFLIADLLCQSGELDALIRQPLFYLMRRDRPVNLFIVADDFEEGRLLKSGRGCSWRDRFSV